MKKFLFYLDKIVPYLTLFFIFPLFTFWFITIFGSAGILFSALLFYISFDFFKKSLIMLIIIFSSTLIFIFDVSIIHMISIIFFIPILFLVILSKLIYNLFFLKKYKQFNNVILLLYNVMIGFFIYLLVINTSYYLSFVLFLLDSYYHFLISK